MATPPSSTAPLRDPASRRTAECASRCQGEESSARTRVAIHATDNVPARPSAARMGTIGIMGRLYSQVRAQTIELLVIPRRNGCEYDCECTGIDIPGLIDRNATRYQDMNQHQRGLFG